MRIMLNCKASATLLCVGFFLNYVMSLELTALQVPIHVPLGIRAELLCQWTLGSNDTLYSVKWYKDGKEFFRHVPRNAEPLKTFVLPGVDVEEFNSSGSKLTVAPVIVASSGRYRCEVSGEGPQFQTVSKYSDMVVVGKYQVVPSHDLNIRGFKTRYQVGDHVNATCSSSQYKPAMKFAWYINGESPLGTLRPENIENGETSLGIEFTVIKSLVGNLKLQCLVTVGSEYWRSIETYALVTEIGEHTLKDSTVSSTNAQSGRQGIKGHYFLVALNVMLLFFTSKCKMDSFK